MGRKRGEPTTMVRIFVADAERLTSRAKAEGVSVAALVGSLLDGRRARSLPQPGVPTAALLVDERTGQPARCSCKAPVISKVVSNLCTACGRRRPG